MTCIAVYRDGPSRIDKLRDFCNETLPQIVAVVQVPVRCLVGFGTLPPRDSESWKGFVNRASSRYQCSEISIKVHIS